MTFKSFAKSAFAATALAVAMFSGSSLIGSGEAEARGRHHHHHGHHHHHHRHGFHRGIYFAPFVVAGAYGGSCYWLKVKAYETGSRYWYNRYYACRGFY